jgi:hypothetical protein
LHPAIEQPRLQADFIGINLFRLHEIDLPDVLIGKTIIRPGPESATETGITQYVPGEFIVHDKTTGQPTGSLLLADRLEVRIERKTVGNERSCRVLSAQIEQDRGGILVFYGVACVAQAERERQLVRYLPRCFAINSRRRPVDRETLCRQNRPNGGAPAAAQAACAAVPAAELVAAISAWKARRLRASKKPFGLTTTGAQKPGEDGVRLGLSAKAGSVFNASPPGTAIAALLKLAGSPAPRSNGRRKPKKSSSLRVRILSRP